MKLVFPQGALALSLAASFLLFTACGKGGSPASAPISAAAQKPAAKAIVDSEGQPVVETAETLGPDFDDVATQAPVAGDEKAADVVSSSLVDVGAKVGFLLPDFQASWGMSRSVYDKAVTYMDLHGDQFANQRYVMVVDMSKHSSKKRFFLFDLETGKLEMHNVAHGSGSDPSATGYAKLFSNVNDSEKTSLGAYKTSATYNGKHGLQLRLVGLESTNSAALERGIVLHGANYVSDDDHHAGRSWGCPALDPSVSKGVINRVKGGAMLLIWK